MKEPQSTRFFVTKCGGIPPTAPPVLGETGLVEWISDSLAHTVVVEYTLLDPSNYYLTSTTK